MPGALANTARALVLPAATPASGVGRRAGIVLTVAAVAVTAAVATTTSSEHPALVVLARAAAVGVPIAIGLHARRRRRDDRFGLLLIAMGAASFVTTFAESAEAPLYTTGRVAGWLFEVLLAYVILSFPTGHLQGRVDRALAGAVAIVAALLYVPRIVLAEHFEVPSPFTSCMKACPENALFPLHREPGFVVSVMQPAGAVLVFLVMLLIAARLLDRIRVGTPLARRMFAPVFAVAAGIAGALAVGILARQVDSSQKALEAVAWVLALAAPVLALACFASFVRWRLMAGQALERLAVCLDTTPDCAMLRQALADAFGDPGLRILFPASGPADGWYDCAGRATELPGADTPTAITEVRRNGSVVATLVHDVALRDQPELVAAGSAIAALALDTNRLQARAEAATREVEESRARLSASAERERRRIERDLHDGAQQRLVALRIELELTEALVVADAQRGAARLQALEGELDEALEEIRSLAHGMYPPLLADRGLSDALRASVRAAGVPVELETHEIGRYPPEIESAVYFCVREALQNVLKHATGARRTVVTVDGGVPGQLRFSVKDNGAGAPGGVLLPGTGITNMHDRVAAVNGELSVRSTPGVGTVVRGRVPVPAADRAGGAGT
jgi:signal transduction histidine kinase